MLAANSLPSLVLCLWQLREWAVQDMNSCVACTKSLSTVETDQVIQPQMCWSLCHTLVHGGNPYVGQLLLIVKALIVDPPK